MANLRIQLEAKDSAYKQALVKLDHHHQTAHELSTFLMNSDLEKIFYISQSGEANTRINELEWTLELMSDQLSESQTAQDKLSHITTELDSTRSQLLNTEKELAILINEKTESLSHTREMDKALSEEKRKTEELLRQVYEMSEAITHLKTKVDEVERGKATALSAKEAVLELVTKMAFEAEEALRYTENQLLEKTTYIHILEVELKQANELKNNIELHERKSAELNESIESMKTELEKIKETENDAQVEIALLRVELHKGRSKLASSEAAAERAEIEKSALYNALQNMGLEAEETKRENRMLKEAMRLSEEEQNEDEAKDALNEKDEELENTKKELEIAMAKIGELRARAEQAISRAEVAEKIKAALEEKMNRRKEQKEKRKAALVALREESVSRDFRNSDSVTYEASSAKNYQPLGKVLNMKF